MLDPKIESLLAVAKYGNLPIKTVGATGQRLPRPLKKKISARNAQAKFWLSARA